MPSINVDLNFFENLKTTRLTGRLGDSSALCLIRLWCYVGTHSPEAGGLTDWTAEEVEAVCHWDGEKGVLVKTLLELQLIHTWKNGYKVHDWMKHGYHLHAMHVQSRAAAKSRWAKEKKYRKSVAGKEKESDASALRTHTENVETSDAPAMPIQYNTIQYNTNIKAAAAYARARENEQPENQQQANQQQEKQEVPDSLLQLAQESFGMFGHNLPIELANTYPVEWIEKAIRIARTEGKDAVSSKVLVKKILARFEREGGPNGSGEREYITSHQGKDRGMDRRSSGGRRPSQYDDMDAYMFGD